MNFWSSSFSKMFLIKDPATVACIVPNIPYPQLPDDASIGAPQQVLDGYLIKKFSSWDWWPRQTTVLHQQTQSWCWCFWNGVVPHEGLCDQSRILSTWSFFGDIGCQCDEWCLCLSVMSLSFIIFVDKWIKSYQNQPNLLKIFIIYKYISCVDNVYFLVQEQLI